MRVLRAHQPLEEVRRKCCAIQDLGYYPFGNGTKENSIRIYRYGVRRFFPNLAAAETLLHQNNFPQDAPSDDFNQLRDDLLQAPSSGPK